MTRHDLEVQLAKIETKDAEGDFEAAHAREDELLWGFVAHVMKGKPGTKLLARRLVEWSGKHAGRSRPCA